MSMTLLRKNLNAAKPPEQSKGFGGNIVCKALSYIITTYRTVLYCIILSSIKHVPQPNDKKTFHFAVLSLTPIKPMYVLHFTDALPWVNSIMSGKSPSLYGTLTLIAIQGPKQNKTKAM